MAWGIPAAIIGSTVLGSLLNKGEKTTQSQQPIETPEQREARQLLLSFARTGRLNDLVLGEDIGLDFSKGYDPTDIEQAGLGRLRSLLASGEPADITRSRSVLDDILASSQGNVDDRFGAYGARVDRATQEAMDALKRSAAYSGGLYGTQAIRGLGDIGARGQEVKAEQLANLTNEALNRNLNVASQFSGLGQMLENIQMGRVGASQTYGSLERLLESAQQEAQNQEKLRKRGEQFQTINALTTVGGQAPQFGVPEVTTYQPSQFENLLNMVANLGGQYLAGKAYGAGAKA